MKISPTTLDDLVFLADIEVSAAQRFLNVPELAWLAGAPVQTAAQHEALIQEGYHWVARNHDGLPVGFLNAQRFDDALHIWEMSVHADYQGRGLGRALMEHAIKQAQSIPVGTLSLTTFRDVTWNAPFYARLGFKVLDTRAMPQRLKDVLAAEGAHGLPTERRCAMVLDLR